ncbi:transmembrane protein, putative [Medicago truncatula]|uniref:Transmembrane protein, putative n=1 Tax=Medicago truncatula TaxID=3880 RepID=A0A072U9T2_MEDTR|nr:transmembrane protein, putative [Medicago truncatula]
MASLKNIGGQRSFFQLLAILVLQHVHMMLLLGQNLIGHLARHYLDNYKKVNKQVDDQTDKEPIVKNKQTDLYKGENPTTGVIPAAQAIAGSSDTTHLQNLKVQNNFESLLLDDEETPDKEVNNELVISDDSSTCSEFIDATQLNNEDIEVEDRAVVTSPNK